MIIPNEKNELFVTNSYDFAAVRPIGRIGDKPRPDRIFPHVVPLLRLALTASQKVIEESTLPDGIA